MPKYARQPEVIEAVQVPPPGEVLVLPGQLGIKVQEQQGGSIAVWNHARGQWLMARPGDWLRIDRPEDVYPIDPVTFARTYRLVIPDNPAEA